jgi:hypothetical protein
LTKRLLGWILQGVVLEILVALGIIQSHHIWVDVKRIEEALQNVLVRVEMVFFLLFHEKKFDEKKE